MNWCIMPYLDCPDLTEAAVEDVMAQRLPDVRLLLINNGSTTDAGRALGARMAARFAGEVFLWSYDPGLPSLAAVWNGALTFVWSVGGTHALVVNNDVRLHPDLYAALLGVQQYTNALFVSAVNVGEAYTQYGELPETDHLAVARGGPDFSCYVITQACHAQYPFDEGFTPAYCEDCSYHRRLMLDDQGTRIFSVCVPYLHYGSGTLNAMPPEARARKEQQIGGARGHYQALWGGPPNQEVFILPFGPDAYQGVTNPDLQRAIAEGRPIDAILGGAGRIATPDSPTGC